MPFGDFELDYDIDRANRRPQEPTDSDAWVDINDNPSTGLDLDIVPPDPGKGPSHGPEETHQIIKSIIEQGWQIPGLDKEDPENQLPN